MIKYAQYMPNKLKYKLQKIPDFDVLSEEPYKTAEIIKEKLINIGVKNITLIKRPGIGDIIAPHYEIQIGKNTIGFIYEPLACHSYNTITISKGLKAKIATIDTMLSFWLAFLYADRPYYDKDRILCMSKYLFDVQKHNRLAQKGLLKRFSITCLGHQETIEEMRAEKAKKYNELKGKKGIEYDEWFLRYRPSDKLLKKEIDTKSKSKSKSKSLSKKVLSLSSSCANIESDTKTNTKTKTKTKRKKSKKSFLKWFL